MRRIRGNNEGSVFPVLIYIVALAIVSVIFLILDEAFTPFYQLYSSTDTSIIDPAFDGPRLAGNAFINIVWPKGVLLVIFIVLDMALIMEYQKSRYTIG